MSVEINATNFPDAAWRQYVIDKIDSNHDGVLSDSDIANRESLTCIGISMSSIQGISFLINLKNIDFTSCTSLTNISDLYNLTKVESLYLKYCTGLSEINLAPFKTTLRTFEYSIHDGDRQNINLLNIGHCTELRRFHVYNYLSTAQMNSINPQISYVTINSSKSFDASALTLLESLVLYAIDIETLNVSGCPHLERLQGEYTNISSIDLISNTALKVLSLSYTDITSLNVSILSTLEELLVDHTGISSIDISSNINLKILAIGYTSIQQLDVGSNTRLENLSAGHCTSLSELSGLENCSELIWLHVFDSLLDNSDIDLTKLPKLHTFSAYGCYGITKINLGNTPLLLWVYENIQPTYDNDQRGINAFYNANVSNVGLCELTLPKSTQIVTDGSSVLEPPLITVQPKDATVIENMPATFYVKVTGNNLVYQWEVSTEEGSWTELSGETSDTYSIIPVLAMSGYKYCCIISNENGTTVSDAATLTVSEDTRLTLPTITSHPSSKTVSEGDIVLFTVIAEGEDIHYQWQTNQNGTWYNINGATAQSYSFTPGATLNNVSYRCQVSNAAGAVYSNSAILSVRPETSIETPVIVTPITSITVTEGSMAYFRCVAGGKELVYQWKVKRNGTWYNITGANNNVYAFTPSLTDNGNQYRCFVSNAAGETYTNVATLTVQKQGPVTLYGYHSIIISGKNTYGEWEMYPTSRPHVAPPEVKTTYVDVPGGNGGLDYTELLIGQPTYGYRKGSWEFMLIPQEKWPQVYKSLVDYLHGRIHTVVLEDDLVHEYTGRLSVNKWESLQRNSTIVIDYILEPEVKDTSGESYSSDDADLQAAARVLRKPANAGKVITLWNNIPYIMPIEEYYDNGDNTLY